MPKSTKKQAKSWQVNPSIIEAAKKQKELAETLEVIGRHKSDGQKDHKGTR